MAKKSASPSRRNISSSPNRSQKPLSTIPKAQDENIFLFVPNLIGRQSPLQFFVFFFASREEASGQAHDREQKNDEKLLIAGLRADEARSTPLEHHHLDSGVHSEDPHLCRYCYFLSGHVVSFRTAS
ncbi:hypothetical protein BJ508DRAFT_163615 [Ascobolus immersus RN42]|uniref:Uncharacterized protein n=1 Tax=Ascobolus immersus RN42 TaxID=1160509 RepID=A0A3N4I7R3_ASCIM|nr:hypothetical protein BJ508DRAFT_163615 [Ascobolus immersus RN42]